MRLPILPPKKNYLSSRENTNMTVAYVLINTEAGSEYSVYDEIKVMEGVVEVSIVYGLYDLVVKVETENIEKLSYLVDLIRKIAGIRSTLTLVGI
jgi:Lrp/AsnC family transcriptional regulator for asnA, asnC and gidA